ncbi:MAG: DUF2683 family protein [Sphingobacteriales bacterium]
MTTITIKIDEKKKAGKTLLELIDFFNTKGKKVVEVVEEKGHYDAKFVKKIKESEKQIKEGKYTEIDPKNVWGSLGL